MIPKFAETCDAVLEVASRNGIGLAVLMLHLKIEHNNPSWFSTLRDLKTLVEELTGETIEVSDE